MSAAPTTHPQVRRLAFSFDETTPLQWNRANPMFGFMMLGLSFIAPPFERYMVTATRMAMPHITDPDVAAEANAFLRQEAQHARAHRIHTAALIAQYPGLDTLRLELERRFDALLETKPLQYHLAYAADIEATFTPTFNMWLRHRDVLFDNGNPDITPLFLWHLVEEIEHRSSAYLIYNAVVPDRWYRVRQLPGVMRHIVGCFSEICRALDEHVPFEDRLAPATELAMGWSETRAKLMRRFARPTPPPRYTQPFASISRREQLAVTYRLVRAQDPRHSPAGEETPPFADEWIAAFDQGRDVVDWYGRER
jgi:predicted metal-dependent hydrolase